MVVELIKENELVELFADEHKALSDSIFSDYKSVSEKSWGAFKELSLDLKKNEAWRYFPYAKFIETLKNYAKNEAPTKILDVVEASSDLGDNAIHLVNGSLDKTNQLESHIEVTQIRYAEKDMVGFFDQFLKSEDEGLQNPLVFLNGSLASSAILIKVKPSDKGNATLKIELLSNEPVVSWPMIGFEMAPGASLNVELHINSEDGESLTVANIFAHLNDSSQLNIDLLQSSNVSRGLMIQNRMVVEKSAELTLNGFGSGGQFNRIDTEVRLVDENSRADVNFLTMTRNDQQQHHYIHMKHEAPNCISDQLFRNLLFDRSMVTVDGTVVVAVGAIQTASSQLINNLFFSDDAKANTKPNLSILNDDVKCNHGATFGQLEEESLFYLKSRGLSEELAIELLTKSFATEVIEKFHSKLVQDKIKAILSNK